MDENLIVDALEARMKDKGKYFIDDVDKENADKQISIERLTTSTPVAEVPGGITAQISILWVLVIGLVLCNGFLLYQIYLLMAPI